MFLMSDFWAHSGFNLAGRDRSGKLVASDELLRAWWRRPEVAPVDESCAAERKLHAALIAEPRRAVSATELARMRDPDAIENYGVMLAWRDRLLASPTLEDAYLGIFGGDVTVPPVFIDQLVELLLRGMLDGTGSALEARAAELFFRPQKATIQDGAVMLADAETVARHESGGAYGDIGRLLVEAKIKPRTVQLDVIDRENQHIYWERDAAHDTVLAFVHDGAGSAAFCRVIEKWIAHLHGVEVRVEPLRAIEDSRWSWHIGLDAEASGILNDLYCGRQVDAARKARILSLFRLDFADASVMRPDIAGRPVYLGCAMNAAQIVRIKPQNLLLNLPLAAMS
jgi:hypothetical protein